MTRRSAALSLACAATVAAGWNLWAVPQVWACYGVPCSPTVCELAGDGSGHTGHTLPTSPQIRAEGPGFKNMTLLANLPLAQIGGGAGSSLYGWTDPLTHREYAIMGRSNGTAFVDITDPRNPKYVANLPKVTGTSDTQWREPKVYQNTVYIGVDGTSVGMQVMDLTKLRQYTGTTLQLTANSVYNNVTRIHTLAINPDTGYLYAEGTRSESTGLGGLHIIDVRNPASPTFVSEFNGDGYTHETQVVTYNGPDAAYQGRELAFNSNGKVNTNTDSFSIVDVTNKSAITRISTKTYPNARFIHQGWLSEDQRYFFQNDELDEQGGVTGGHTRTHVWDVTDLDNPVYKGFVDQATTSIDHNLYVKNGFLFETNYTTGLRMFKLGDLSSANSSSWFQEVAYYDTYTANDGATFNGAWNNYPFFKSGNIVVSDINGGLFVIQPHVPGWHLGNFDGGGDGGNGGGGPNSPEPGTLGILSIAALGGLARRRR
jgi:choice-of-anchor B domain-containing protein